MIDFSNRKPRLANQPWAQSKQVAPATTELVFETVILNENGLKGSARAASKMNDIAGTFVAALLLVAPVPIGANHPLAWLGFAVAISVFLVLYALLMLYFDPGRPSRSCRYPVIFC